MDNKKTYIYLYYFSLILTLFACFLPIIFMNNIDPNSLAYSYLGLSELSFFILFINIVLVIIFTIFLIKRKIKSINIVFPIIYIAFTIIVLIICHLFDNRLIIPYIQYSYYIYFILINYTLLNIYSLLSFNKKKKN